MLDNGRRRLGAALQTARLRTPFSLRAAGERLDPVVSPAYLSDVEKGRRSLPAARLMQLVRLYNIGKEPAARLFCLVGELPPQVQENLLRSPESWGDWMK